MEQILKNVDLAEISIKRIGHMIFDFLSCYNGRPYKTLECSHVIKCSIDNEAFEDEEFAYFIADIYVKELNTAEVESSIKNYKYGYNVNFAQVNKLYSIFIIGSEIYIEILCGDYKIIEISE